VDDWRAPKCPSAAVRTLEDRVRSRPGSVWSSVSKTHSWSVRYRPRPRAANTTANGLGTSTAEHEDTRPAQPRLLAGCRGARGRGRSRRASIGTGSGCCARRSRGTPAVAGLGPPPTARARRRATLGLGSACLLVAVVSRRRRRSSARLSVARCALDASPSTPEHARLRSARRLSAPRLGVTAHPTRHSRPVSCQPVRSEWLGFPIGTAGQPSRGPA
jgi:hypothetical protein